jgi:hypothetical protein
MSTPGFGAISWPGWLGWLLGGRCRLAGRCLEWRVWIYGTSFHLTCGEEPDGLPNLALLTSPPLARLLSCVIFGRSGIWFEVCWRDASHDRYEGGLAI